MRTKTDFPDKLKHFGHICHNKDSTGMLFISAGIHRIFSNNIFLGMPTLLASLFVGEYVTFFQHLSKLEQIKHLNDCTEIVDNP